MESEIQVSHTEKRELIESEIHVSHREKREQESARVTIWVQKKSAMCKV